MTSLDHDTAEADAATEALILQLIAQDFGQQVPQTLLGTDSELDHHEANSHWDNQSSDSQWNIQNPDNQCDNPGSDVEEDQTSKPSDNQSALLAEEELPGSRSRYVSVEYNNTGI